MCHTKAVVVTPRCILAHQTSVCVCACVCVCTRASGRVCHEQMKSVHNHVEIHTPFQFHTEDALFPARNPPGSRQN